MAKDYLVYLAGPIGGLSYFEATAWRDYVLRALDGICPDVRCLSPIRSNDFLQNEQEIDLVPCTNPLSTDKGMVSRDRFDCTRANLILFNLTLSPDKISARTCIEIGWADTYRIPMVAALTPGSAWDRPMVRQLIPFIVPTLDEAVELIPRLLLPKRVKSAYQVN